MAGIRQKLAWGVLLAVVSCHSFAQFGGGGGMGGGMGGGRRGRSADTPPASRANEQPTNPQAQANALRDKLYDLRLRLMITPEQTALWDAFYSKMWDIAAKGTMSRPATTEDVTAVELFQRRAADAKDRAARLQELADALDKLYAGLTPEQKHTADQALTGVLP